MADASIKFIQQKNTNFINKFYTIMIEVLKDNKILIDIIDEAN